MPLQPLNTLKAWFETGDKPTQSNFWDWLDSYWHKSETIPQSSVDGLEDALTGFATMNDIAALKAINLTTFSSSASLNIPAGTIAHVVRVKSTSAITFNLGTSGGGNQILDAEALSANQVGVYTTDFDCETLTTIHFSGLAGTTNIKIFLLQ